jgi:hypothetical protein
MITREMSTSPFKGHYKLTTIEAHEEYHIPLFLHDETKFYIKPETNKVCSLSTPAFSSASTHFEDVNVFCSLDNSNSHLRFQVLKESTALTKFIIGSAFHIVNKLNSKIHIQSSTGTITEIEPGQKEPVYEYTEIKMHIRIQKDYFNIAFDPSCPFDVGIMHSENSSMCLQYKKTCIELEFSAEFVVQNDSGISILLRDCNGRLAVLSNSQSTVLNSLANNILEFAVIPDTSEEDYSFLKVFIQDPPFDELVSLIFEQENLTFVVYVCNTCTDVKKITISSLWFFHNDTDRNIIVRELAINSSSSISCVLKSKERIAWPWTMGIDTAVCLRYSDSLEETTPVILNLIESHVVLRINDRVGLRLNHVTGQGKTNNIFIKSASISDLPIIIANMCKDLVLRIHQKSEKQSWLVRPGLVLNYTWDNCCEKQPLCCWSTQESQKSFSLPALPGKVLWGKEKIACQSMKFLSTYRDSDTSDSDEVSSFFSYFINIFFMKTSYFEIFVIGGERRAKSCLQEEKHILAYCH